MGHPEGAAFLSSIGFVVADGPLQSRFWPIVWGVVFLAIGVALFRAAGKIEAGSSPSAILDLATSLFGVCLSGVFLYFCFPYLQVVWFVVCAIVAGVSSSALFRLKLKPPE